MDLSTFVKDILIVIVIYKREVHEVLKNVPLNNADVYIYDNSPLPQNTNGDKLIYQHDPTNSGVSAAYNHAFNLAIRLGKKWMLLLDHDTSMPSDLISAFHHAYTMYPSAGAYVPHVQDGKGIVSPYRLFLGRGVRMGKPATGVLSFKRYRFINSGMLISTELFQSAGGYDERFPLDLSDVVFINRLKKLTTGFIAVDISCSHHLSLTDTQQDIRRTKERFHAYCRSVRLYKNLIEQRTMVKALTVPLGMKLGISYRDVDFVRIALGA